MKILFLSISFVLIGQFVYALESSTILISYSPEKSQWIAKVSVDNGTAVEKLPIEVMSENAVDSFITLDIKKAYVCDVHAWSSQNKLKVFQAECKLPEQLMP